MEELKPCSCCGNKEIKLEYNSGIGYRVKCHKCGLGLVETDWTREYAIEAWNKRA
jgi:hypothetical protein